MTNDLREFMKGGANIHVKSHYRTVNGKLVYVHDHDKMGSPVGTEAQLHERVQHAKNAAHLMAIDPEDRDTVLKHAGQLGLKPEVKYQGGKIKDHEGNSKAHGFHYIKFDNEDDAKKVHASITAASKGEEKPAEAPAQQQEPDQPKDKVGTHPNDAVKAAESKLQGFISYGKPGDIKAAIEGSTGITPEAGLTVVEQGIKYTQEAIDAAEAYEKETGQKAPNAQTYHDIMAKMNTWKAQLQEKAKPAEATATAEPKAEEKKPEAPKMAIPKGAGKSGPLGVPSSIDKHSITQFPSGKWGFVGKVPHQLLYRHEDGSPASEEEVGKIQLASTPEMMVKQLGLKKQVFASKEEAEAFAEEAGYPVEGAKAAPSAEATPADDTTGPVMGLTAQHSVVDPSGKKWDVIKASKDHGDVVLEDADGKKKKMSQQEMKEKGFRIAEEPKDGASGVSIKETAHSGKYQVTFGEPGSATIGLLDEQVDKETAEKLNEAIAKRNPVTIEHAREIAKEEVAKLQEKVKPAEPETKEAAAASEEGDHQEQLSKLMSKAEAAFHDDPAAAVDALRKAAELGEKHGIKYQHKNGVGYSPEWMKQQADKIEAAMPKAPAVDEEYANAAKVATESSAAANEHSKGLKADYQNGEHTPDKAESTMKGHVAAKEAHRNAKAAHKKAADHAPTPELKAHHEAEASKHDAKADVHESAADMHAKQHKKNQTQAVYDTEASKADAETQTANDHSKEKLHSESSDDHHDGASLHESAAKAHTGMIQHALANGDEQSANEHASIATQHQKKAAYHKAAAEAWKATNESDHEKAFRAHSQAYMAADETGDADAATLHAKKSTEHQKAMEVAKPGGNKSPQEKKADYDAKHAHAIDLTDAANQSGSHDDHVAAAEAHYEAHKAAKEAHGEDSVQAKAHLGLNQQHGEQANKAHQQEQGKAPEPSNPWKGKDHNGPASKAYEAEKKGDIAGAINHYKDAAVIAHHNGDAENAKKYILLVKDLQKQGTQKAVDTEPFTGNPQTLVVAIQSAAIQLHQEKQQVRNLIKAVDTMPSFGKLQKACAQATKAGITGIDDIVAHALGGKQQAAPYLAFLAQVNQ